MGCRNFVFTCTGTFLRSTVKNKTKNVFLQDFGYETLQAGLSPLLLPDLSMSRYSAGIDSPHTRLASAGLFSRATKSINALSRVKDSRHAVYIYRGAKYRVALAD